MIDIDILRLLSTISTAAVAFVAITVFIYNKRKSKFDVIEQSFDVLQRLNEKALQSDENLIAAIRSGNLDDVTTADDARIIYFHYMRINRMFRAYEYYNGKYISKKQAERIIDPHLGTLRPLLPDKLRIMLKRGYPDDFADFLVEKVKISVNLPPITNADNKNMI